MLNEWGVFTDGTCPDPGAFSEDSHLIKKYVVPEDGWEKPFEKLMEVQRKLNKEKIIPTPQNKEDIYPKSEDILED